MKKSKLNFFAIFKINKSKAESHLDIFLRFFTVEVFAGLIIVIVSYTWLTFIGGESNLTDLKYNLKTNIIDNQTSDIVIVTLTDEEYDTLRVLPQYRDEFQAMQKYSFPRKYLAQLVHAIEKYKPKIVALDILLDVKSTSSELDNQLSETFSQYDNLVFCSDFSTWRNREIPPLKRYWDRTKHVVGHVKLFREENDYPYIQHLVKMNDGQIVPSFSFAAYMRLEEYNSNNQIRKSLMNLFNLTIDSLDVPYSSKELFSPQFISFSEMIKNQLDRRYGFNFNTYESGLILKGGIPENWIRDKIILIGATYEESKDFGIIPLNNRNNDSGYSFQQGNFTPGVFIHACILSDLLTKNIIRKVNPYVIIFVCIFILIFIVVLFSRIKFVLSILFSFVLIFFFAIINIGLFASNYSYYFPLAGPSILFFFTVLFMIFLSSYKKESTIDYIRRIWGPYVPKERLQSIIELTKLGQIKPGAVGKAEIITVVYLKLEGINSIFPSLEDDKLTEFDFTDQIRTIDKLIDLLKSEVVFLKRFKGASERFLGNGILFYFGIPVGENDQIEAYRAVICAWELKQKFMSLVNTFPEMQQYFPNIKIKICVHSGGIVVGEVRNLENRIEPTVITQIFEEIYNSLAIMSVINRDECIIITETTHQLVQEFVETKEVKIVHIAQPEFKLYALKKLNKVGNYL